MKAENDPAKEKGMEQEATQRQARSENLNHKGQNIFRKRYIYMFVKTK